MGWDHEDHPAFATDAPPMNRKRARSNPIRGLEELEGHASSEPDFIAALARLQITDDNADEIAVRLLDSEKFLALVISGVKNPEPISRWLEKALPSSLEQFDGSQGLSFLHQLSRALLPLALDRNVADKVMKSHHFLQQIRSALDVLLSIQSNEGRQQVNSRIRANGGELDDEWAGLGISMKRPKQKKKLAIRKPERTVDAKVLAAMGVEIPHSPFEVPEAARCIIERLHEIARLYLDIMRGPGVNHGLMTALFPKTSAVHATLVPQPSLAAPTPQHQDEIARVVPMRAALYFDGVEGFGDWRIQISSKAEKHLRIAKRTNLKLFDIIVKKIKELSQGHFSDDNQKRLNGPNNGVPVYEAKMTRDTRLAYQVDCVSDYSSEHEVQVIRVFGVYTHAQLDGRFWDSMGHQLARKGAEYTRRCIYRNKPLIRQDKVFAPATFPPLPEVTAAIKDPLELPVEHLEKLGEICLAITRTSQQQVVLFPRQQVQCSHPSVTLSGILLDTDATLPFDLTPQERQIVEHTASCYVLGRSGTGKTTTMLFKMLGIQRAHEMQLKRDGNDALHKPRQIFVTQSRVLAAKVEEYFAKLLASLSSVSGDGAAHQPNKPDDGGQLVDEDEEYERRSDLPSRFGQLTHAHFPLFVTYEKLCQLLEGEYGTGEGRSGSMITYHSFESSYWPHFPQTLTKGLDPSLVYSEFMGVIKGSEESLQNDLGCLEEAEYEGLSHRTQATFSRSRKMIYSLFKVYQKQKRSRGEYDAADRTHLLLRTMRKQGAPKRLIDFLYVDEVQDNLLIDALLLRSLCSNPNGLFWAGDTAQTISVGSSFRFNDLKSFLFRVEEKREKDCPIPATFQLLINYRSHAGIVNAAHSVISLITKFWPYSIDALARETGVVEGLKPVFFRGYESDSVRYEQFLFGASGNPIEFGAQQVILVRDEEAQKRLKEQVGDIGLILTLYESKGLEFNDVLLYNFFEDSCADVSTWRVILNGMAKPTSEVKAMDPAPQFDPIKHAKICSELKFLYVAITRARKNMWIVDTSERAEPMRLFWTSQDQVQNCTPGTDVPHLAVSSTPEEWAQSGRTLFRNKNYFQARHCFERAFLPKEVNISNAYHLREQARKKDPQSKISHNDSFVSAAQAFLRCGAEAKPQETGRSTYYRIAAECFVKAEQEQEAADAFLLAGSYNEATKLYRKLGHFDTAVSVVQEHMASMDGQLAETIIDTAKIFYLKNKEFLKADGLFESVEEELEYLEDLDMDTTKASLLESLGRHLEAAEVHLVEGRIIDASRLFFRDSTNPNSVRRGVDCVLRGLWQNAPFGTTINPSSASPLAPLVALASTVDLELVGPDVRDEMLMFRALANGERNALKSLGLSFQQAGNQPAALLCFDVFFGHFPAMKIERPQKIAEYLEVFVAYVQLLQDAAMIQDPCQHAHLQKLFGISHSSENVVLVLRGTFLCDQLERIPILLTKRSSGEGLHILEWELNIAFRNCLLDRLKQRIDTCHKVCLQAQAFTPCNVFTITERCNRFDCPHDHAPRPALTAELYNNRVRLHLQHIIVLQLMQCIPERSRDLTASRIAALSRLYEVLCPPVPILGSPNDLRKDSIPEWARGLSIIKEWCRVFISTRTLNPATTPKPFMTTYMRVIMLSYMFDDGKMTGMYLSSSPLATARITNLPPWCTRSGPGFAANSLGEIAAALQNSHESSVAAGMLNICHIIEQQIPTNISVLCDFIEHVAGLLIVSRHMTQHVPLHQMVLPRNWVLSLLLPRLNKTGHTSQFIVLKFIDFLGRLMERILSKRSADHLLFESKNVAWFKDVSPITAMFVTRICKVLALLGYNWRYPLNTPFPNIRMAVLEQMQLLRRVDSAIVRHDRTLSPSYQQYVDVRDWGHVARCVQRMSDLGPFQEDIVQLYHTSRINAGKIPQTRGTRTVTYTFADGVRNILLGLKESSLSADATPFIPAAVASTGQDEATLDEGADAPADDLDAAEEPDENGPNGDEPIVLPEIQLAAPTTTPEEIHAATVIQSAYRRKLFAKPTSKERAVRRYFAQCFAAAEQMEWAPRSLYKKLLLGPVPHLLFCVEQVLSDLKAQKKVVSARLLEAEHLEIERVKEQQDRLKKVIREGYNLQRNLDPKSELHQAKDKNKLRAIVMELDQLVRNTSSVDTSQFKVHLSLAYKAIVTEPKPVEKEGKPDLMVEDDLEYM